MSTTPRRLLVVRAALAAACVCGVASATTSHGSPGEPLDAFQSAPPTFLGFGLGEERRYVLGPAEDLYVGEGAVWSIRLREVLADPPDAIFELTHQWSGAESRSEPPVGLLMSVSSQGELRVNAHGFPLDLRFRTERSLYGYGEHAYTVRYSFADGDFRKTFSVGSRDFEHPIRVRRTEQLDVSVPLGMWAHAPMALECMFSRPSGSGDAVAPIVMTPPTAGSGSSPTMSRAPLRFVDAVECREPLFANPGLLSLMLPTLWETGTGELDFLMLTPAGDYGMPGASGGGATTGGGFGMSGGAGARHFDSEQATRPQTNSEVEHLRYVDRVRIEVGPRTMDAWRFEGMRAFDAVFVDDEGVVLRVDLSPTVSTWTRPADPRNAPLDPTRMDDRGLFIRLLFPSEY